MAMHNLGAVVAFEFIRTLKKKSFWASSLLVPVVVGLMLALSTFSSHTADRGAAAQQQAAVTFQFTDDSGLITDQLAAAYGGTRAADTAKAVQAVKDGKSEAFIHYPKDPAASPVEVRGQDAGLFGNGKYDAVAGQLLRAAVAQKVGDPSLAAIAAGKTTYVERMYRDGVPAGGVFAVVPPLSFLAAFYLLVLFLGNQILSSVTEEKENRVSEMILTSLDPAALIVGKILSILLTGAVQMATFSLPVVAGYTLFRGQLGLPDIPFASLVPDPGTMVVGALLLVGGFLLVAGTLMAIGAVLSTAKEANGVYSALVVLTFVPLYAVPLVLSDPGSPLVRAFTWFPFSAPVTAMLRNGLGSLGTGEALGVTAELFVLGAAAMALAVRLFRHGAAGLARAPRGRRGAAAAPAGAAAHAGGQPHTSRA